PELEKQLVGVVFLNTAPDNYWYRSFAERSKQQDLPNVSLFRKQLLEHPCNAHYAEYLLQSLRYYFREAFLEQGKQLFLTLPFNYKPYFWAIEHFHPTYQASWIPAMPCLIVGSEFDVMTPPDVFEQTPYRANNFRHVTISNAAHFPWIENLSAVQVHLQDFEKVILNA
ncbi:MAG TPA: alpha/beta hydrolase, partial [Gammaproteobacteria bacterium]|nr:alpha/beta hydrolase [Gammaproteobacteria bacterium]